MFEGVSRAAPQPRSWSVAGLLLAAADALAARFSSVTVKGELSSFSRAGSGHCYFTLKDDSGAAAGLRCVMFRRHAQLLNFNAQDGQQVEVRGRLALYEARGELQLVVESLQRVGSGALYEEFLRLKARLQAQGWFEAERKRALPARPFRVGLVTSPSGAALHDVLSVLRRRTPYLELVLYPSLVQGADAPLALAQAIELANARSEVDVLLLCRGGGSLEDLWAFNTETVVTAVAMSQLPVVCGVGHETDVSLADLAADVRAATPTAAAELVAPAQVDLLADLAALEDRMQRRLQAVLDGQQQRLDQLSFRMRGPGQAMATLAARLDGLDRRRCTALAQGLRDGRQRLHDAAGRFDRAMGVHQQRSQSRLEAVAARLAAVDPRRVLQRGYTWVQDSEGRAVTSVHQVTSGQAIQAVWVDGVAQARVERLMASSLPLKPETDTRD